MSTVFVSGGTGYLGRPLIEALVQRGWDVQALCRPQSIGKVPAGATPVPGNALEAASFSDDVPRGAVYVHLTGVAHPSPAKAGAFQTIDLASFRASLHVACSTGARRFVYVSVAHPAPVMHDYVAVRQECERAIQKSGLDAAILRPWYVLGPGHWWPYLLVPIYKIASAIPALRAASLRLGLLRRDEMIAALVYAVECPEPGIQFFDVPKIREISCEAVSA